MSDGDFQVSVPKDVDIQELESKLNQVWKESLPELIAISKKYDVDFSSINADDKLTLSQIKLVVRPIGGGIEPTTIALLISLAPLIKALSPILTPPAKSASNVAEKIALDVWEHIKTKLWQKDHLALREKK